MNIVFFGDSICFGQGNSPHLSWAGLLSKEIEKKFGDKVVVSNQGINGQTTRQALERIAYDVQSHRPQLLVVQFGLNDANYWATDNGLPRVSLEAYEANLEEIIRRAYANGTQRIILNTNHIPSRILDPLKPNQYSDNVYLYNQAVRSVAKRTGVNLIDIEKSIQDFPEVKDGRFLLSDGVHLSKLGNKLYFDQIQGIVIQEIVTCLALS